MKEESSRNRQKEVTQGREEKRRDGGANDRQDGIRITSGGMDEKKTQPRLTWKGDDRRRGREEEEERDE